MSKQVEGHICPRPQKGMLPTKIFNAAGAGQIQVVYKWLSEGGNINASDEMDQTLLHAACQDEHAELVTKLLEDPDIHINIRLDAKSGLTPFGIAVTNGSLDIMEILMKAKLNKCVFNPSIIFERSGRALPMTAITVAILGKRWEVLRLMLKYHPCIREWEAFHIIGKTIEDYEFDIAQVQFQSNFQFKEQDFGNLIQEVYTSKKWELTETIFSKNLFHYNDSSKRLFYLLITQRDWPNLETYLRLMNGEAKIHVEMVEAVLTKKEDKVDLLLEEVKQEQDIMTGTLLAATVGGTSEKIAELLVKCNSINYSDETLNNALLLASINSRMEFIQHLLFKKKYSLKILSRSRSISCWQNKFDVSNVITKVIEERSKELSTAQKIFEQRCPAQNVD